MFPFPLLLIGQQKVSGSTEALRTTLCLPMMLGHESTKPKFPVMSVAQV